MTAKDLIHDAVRAALVKDGWTITDDPFTIEYEDVRVYADLAAERPASDRGAARRIVVEIKSFISPSPVFDLELAIGQYELYRCMLEFTGSDQALYLAVSSATHENVLDGPTVEAVLARLRIALLIVDVEKPEVAKWIS